MLGESRQDPRLYWKHLPFELRELPHWLGWRRVERDGKYTKVPICPITGQNASVTNPATWSPFEATLAALRNHPEWSGLGFVFTADDPYTGIDLDNCIDAEGAIASWAQEIIELFSSYTEISPSGRGVHIIVRGSLPRGRCRKGSIEVYDHSRYFAMTGRILSDVHDSIKEMPNELQSLYQRYLSSDSEATPASSLGGSESHSEEDLLRILRGRATFERLWGGDLTGYESQSEADLALCGMLASKTTDAARIDQVFRRSGLMRTKWDERHSADGRTYGELTLVKALERRGGVMPELPRLECGAHAQLEVIEAHSTPRRRTIVSRVYVDGRDTQMELNASLSDHGLKTASNSLIDCIELAKGLALDETEKRSIRVSLRTALNRDSFTGVSAILKQRQRLLEETDGARRTMFDIAADHLREELGFAFIEHDGAAWSESLGRSLRQSEFISRLSPALLNAVSAARDYPAPTDLDPTKPHRHLSNVLKPVWMELTQELPDEAHADSAGPDSRAGQRFRTAIQKIWESPETWLKDSKDQHVERSSLGSRVRVLARTSRAEQRSVHWRRVLSGVVGAYFEVGSAGHISLGMSHELCQGVIRGARIPSVRSFDDLSALMTRYALAERVSTMDQADDDDSGRPIVVLERRLTERLVHDRIMPPQEVERAEEANLNRSESAEEKDIPSDIP